MLGMYVHTHWGYHPPYAARSWTLRDWRGYLAGLRALGYDLLMFWPLLDAMPPELTPSDRALLAQTAQVIRLAHHEFGMRFLITVGPNVMGNERAAAYRYEERPYFVCERKVNPRDPQAMEAMLRARHEQFEWLREADGIVIIDSDPGGYIGSTNEEFVELLAAQIDVLRRSNPQGELWYWMWVGWENYNRFWAEAQRGEAGNAEPRLRVEAGVFAHTLEMMTQRIPEPWSLLVAWPEHLETTRQLGLIDKRLYIPYGAIEGEPTFPLTNYSPSTLYAAVNRYPGEPMPHGIMGNTQTACLQAPSLYLLAHYAQGGSDATADVVRYAEGLIPGRGETIAAGWRAIAGSAEEQRQAAEAVQKHIGETHREGRYAGLLFGDADRFLADLAQNLLLRAALADLGEAIGGGQAGPIKQTMQWALDQLRPYQKRLGFVDAYGGPLYTMLNEPLARLHDPAIDAVLRRFHDWRDPSTRNGVVPHLLDVMGRYAEG